VFFHTAIFDQTMARRKGRQNEPSLREFTPLCLSAIARRGSAGLQTDCAI
jgi:hypothetical protein